ncbi:hypothetical protein AQUCO_03000221v1 [Aquilegia coerulea]|uniref:Uncharacterized protein n=1 Tax=Aquilegia coerulea TaxID=218851 RepID=A0A2G5D1U8_AQUCA|nr:hypothetical protein AQUCO_03000221v1 [Aquilegia coerulea]
MSISANNFVQENADSDSEGNSDNDDGPIDYYQPISAVEDDDNDQQSNGGDFNSLSTNSENPNFHVGLSNGDDRRIDLNEDDESAEEEEMRRRAEAAERAFREDENRRNAPLSAENATRIMDAMRGISLGSGFTPPDWANRVPEDQWIDQLRRLRVQPPSTSSPSINN